MAFLLHFLDVIPSYLTLGNNAQTNGIDYRSCHRSTGLWWVNYSYWLRRRDEIKKNGSQYNIPKIEDLSGAIPIYFLWTFHRRGSYSGYQPFFQQKRCVHIVSICSERKRTWLTQIQPFSRIYSITNLRDYKLETIAITRAVNELPAADVWKLVHWIRGYSLTLHSPWKCLKIVMTLVYDWVQLDSAWTSRGKRLSVPCQFSDLSIRLHLPTSKPSVSAAPWSEHHDCESRSEEAHNSSEKSSYS